MGTGEGHGPLQMKAEAISARRGTVEAIFGIALLYGGYIIIFIFFVLAVLKHASARV